MNRADNAIVLYQTPDAGHRRLRLRSGNLDRYDHGPFLLAISAAGVHPPSERDHWPAPEYLAAHRREWRL